MYSLVYKVENFQYRPEWDLFYLVLRTHSYDEEIRIILGSIKSLIRCIPLVCRKVEQTESTRVSSTREKERIKNVSPTEVYKRNQIERNP